MRVAIIGLIGSGKSSVMNYLKSLDKNVFDCDVISKEIMARDEVKAEISQKFNITIDAFGELNKDELSRIIFSNSPIKEELETYIHTLVLKELEEISKGYSDIFVEVSAFKDSIVAKFFDVIVGVTCDKAKRIERIVKRNGYSLDKIESIMAVQPTEEEINSISNYVIENDGDIDKMHAQVDRCLDVIYVGLENTIE